MIKWKLPTISTELKPDSPEFSRPQPPRASTTKHMSPLFSSNIFIHHRYQVKEVPILSQFSSPCGQFPFSLELPLQGGLLQILTRSLSTWISMARVTKSENFPDSKIFVAKTFRIKRVNRDNFQSRDKCVQKVVLQDFVHKHGPNMLHTVLDHANSL